jgi:hypothetical protein
MPMWTRSASSGSDLGELDRGALTTVPGCEDDFLAGS